MRALIVVALVWARGAAAQCNVSGISDGCTVGTPYSCASSSTCYASYQACISAVACGGSPTLCNLSGVATGCTASTPYTCPNSTTCHGSYSACASDVACGGLGTGGTSRTCNTSGIASGCSADRPFSCGASTTCYALRSGCTDDPACGGVGTTTVSPSNSSCNTSGIALGCPTSQPFSCSATPTCYSTRAECLSDSRCTLSGSSGPGGSGAFGGGAPGGGASGAAPSWGCSFAGNQLLPLLVLAGLFRRELRRAPAQGRWRLFA